MGRHLSPRFGFYVTVIVAVVVVAVLFEAGLGTTLATLLGVWLAVVVVEVAAARRPPRPDPVPPEPEASAPVPASPAAVSEPSAERARCTGLVPRVDPEPRLSMVPPWTAAADEGEGDDEHR